MDADADPRVYFAAERTLLAWLRTGIAVIGLGFLVSRFGMFLMMVRGPVVDRSLFVSSMIGISFVVLGTVMVAAATWQHLRFVRRFQGSFPPTRSWPALSLCVAALVAVSGLALAVHLALSLMVEHAPAAADGSQPAAAARDVRPAIARGTVVATSWQKAVS